MVQKNNKSMEKRKSFHYHEFQEILLYNVIKGTIIIFLLLVAGNSIWLLYDFWNSMILNILALLVIFIYWWCLKSIKNKRFHITTRIYLSSSLIGSAAAISFVNQQFISICALGLGLFLFLAMFLDVPKNSRYWVILCIGLFWLCFTIRIIIPSLLFSFILLDVLGIFLFPPMLLLGIGVLGYYVSTRFNNALLESEATKESLEQTNKRLLVIQKELRKSEEKYHESYKIADFYKDLIAHDINNILNNISMSSQLFMTYQKEPENQRKIQELMQIINEEVSRGTNLISNVHKLSELEESKMPIQSTECCAPLKESCDSLIKAYQNREVDIQFDFIDKKIFVQANSLLKELFENILDNAVKYNDNPRVEIIAKITKEQIRKQDYIKLEFIDNGIGISDTQKESIFKKGYKEHKGGKGMGFGLSLVKKIIDSYNGQIWVEDKIKGDYTKGSVFSILIPEVIERT